MTPNLRTRESIGKQIKIGHKTRFLISGRAICVIHELMRRMNCCSSGKMLKYFYNLQLQISLATMPKRITYEPRRRKTKHKI